MILKPQDILVLLKLVVVKRKDWTYNQLALELSLSPSEVHTAVKRAIESGLALRRDKQITPNLRNLEEFLCHGIRYVFVVERSTMTRGMPTAHAAPPLDKVFVADGEPIPVWPDAEGTARGLGFSPLHKAAPAAAKTDVKLYELLVLVDAIRAGRARERNFAIGELKKKLLGHK